MTTAADTPTTVLDQLAAFVAQLPEGFTVQMTDAELEANRELQDRPGFAMLKRSPTVMAARQLTTVSRIRFSRQAAAGGVVFGVLAYRIAKSGKRAGLPTGGSKWCPMTGTLTADDAITLQTRLSAHFGGAR